MKLPCLTPAFFSACLTSTVRSVRSLWAPLSSLVAIAALCIIPALSEPAQAASPQAEELTVSAAASLTESLGEIKALFEKAHPGATLVLNFAASGPLLKQIQQGAPVDVFASANQKFMDQAEKEGLLLPGTRKNFVANDLVLAVPADNPAGVRGLEDLKKPGVKRIGLGNPDSVPAGQYAKAALTKAGMFEALAPAYVYGESVRQVLDYLRRAEVDAAFVYATDAAQAGKSVATAAVVPLDENVSYPAAVLAASSHKDLAKAFVLFLSDPAAQAVFRAKGFSIP